MVLLTTTVTQMALIIKVRSKNNLPNGCRTKPSSSYAAFQPQENDCARLAILTMPT